jgi:hypothetical protein
MSIGAAVAASFVLWSLRRRRRTKLEAAAAKDDGHYEEIDEVRYVQRPL